MALKTSQLAVKMALRGAKMAISGVLKYARAYAQDTGFFDFVARRLCLKLLAAKSKKMCFVCVLCIGACIFYGPQDFSAGRQDGPKRGQDGNIGGLKICTRLCTRHRFFRLRCKKVMLKTSCGEVKKNCVLFVFCA